MLCVLINILSAQCKASSGSASIRGSCVANWLSEIASNPLNPRIFQSSPFLFLPPDPLPHPSLYAPLAANNQPSWRSRWGSISRPTEDGVWQRRYQQQHVCRCSTRGTEVGIFNMATVHTSRTTVHQCASSEHARLNDSPLSYFLPSPRLSLSLSFFFSAFFFCNITSYSCSSCSLASSSSSSFSYCYLSFLVTLILSPVTSNIFSLSVNFFAR